jgi:hypothetical protein
MSKMKVSNGFGIFFFRFEPFNPAAETASRLMPFCEHCLDADELEWYIPAGIDLPDLQQSLTVIEQFEQTPFDTQGKRASELLNKKRRRRRRKRLVNASSGSDSDEEAEPRRKARKAREQQNYKSAQFIEDSEEEYEQDIDEFFVREAELRQRTALAAVDSALNIGTMRPTGTKKRRRAQLPHGDAAAPDRDMKRRAVQSSPSSPLSNRIVALGAPSGDDDDDGAYGGNNAAVLTRPTFSSSSSSSSDQDDDDDDDGGGGGIDGMNDSNDGPSSFADLDAASRRRSGAHLTSKEKKKVPQRRVKPRPVYRGASLGEMGRAEEDAVRWSTSTSPPPRMDNDEEGDNDDDDDDSGQHHSSNPVLLQVRKGRLIISDEE